MLKFHHYYYRLGIVGWSTSNDLISQYPITWEGKGKLVASDLPPQMLSLWVKPPIVVFTPNNSLYVDYLNPAY